MTNDAKKKVSNQKAETEKDVNSSVKNGSILPSSDTKHLFEIPDVSPNLNRRVIEHYAPSGNAFVVGDNLEVVMGDKAPITLCSRLEVVSEGCDKYGRGHCRVVRFDDSFGNSRERVIMLSDLVASQSKTLASLVDEGLQLYRVSSQGGNAQIAEFIRTCPVNKRFMTVDPYGWVELGKSFIVPSATIGDTNGHDVVFNGSKEGAPMYGQGGTLEQWQQTIGRNARHSSRVAFAVCMAFTSPLLKFTSEPSGGFHFLGDSGTGKSTAIRAGVSVWAQVLEHDGEAKISWNATANNIESLAKNHSDLPLFLDELGQGENGGLNIEQVLYMLGNGAGKGRMKQDSSPMARNVWRLFFMSAGEKSASELMEQIKRDIATGANVRMATINALPEGGHGVFETIPHGVEFSDFAKSFSDDGGRYYGTAGVSFMKAFIDDVHNRGGVEVMRAYIAEKTKVWLDTYAKNCNYQVARVARRFALVAVAGEMATEYGILPWAVGEASEFASRCFKSFADEFETSDEKKERLCRQVFDFVLSYPENFDSIVPPKKTIYQAKNANPLFGTVIYSASPHENVRSEPVIISFTNEGFKRAGGLNSETKRALVELGYLLTSKSGKDKKTGRQKLVYKYQPNGNSRVIQLGGISLPKGYILVDRTAFTDEARELLKGTVLDENKIGR